MRRFLVRFVSLRGTRRRDLGIARFQKFRSKKGSKLEHYARVNDLRVSINLGMGNLRKSALNQK